MSRSSRRSAHLRRSLGAAILASLLTFVVGTASVAVAVEPNSPVQLSATPVGQRGQFFDLTLSPGETRELSIALSNIGETPIAARTYAANVYTIINGGFGAELRDGTPTGTTTWLDYPTQVLTLEPGAATRRAFSVTMPRDAAAGEYVTSIILENESAIPGDSGGSVAINQIVRQAVAVSIRVPGAVLPGLAIGAASHKLAAGRSVLAVAVSNTGGLRLTPTAAIVVHDAAGGVVSHATVPMDSFYADTSSSVEISLPKALLPGSYTLDLTLDDATHAAHAEARALPVQVITAPAASNVAPAVPRPRRLVEVLQGSPDRFPFLAVGLIAACLLIGGAIVISAHRAGSSLPRDPDVAVLHSNRPPRPQAASARRHGGRSRAHLALPDEDGGPTSP